MMKIAVCEDEELFSCYIKTKISGFFLSKNLTVDIDVFSDGKDLRKQYTDEGGYDIIFMDIAMKESDGMDVAYAIRELDKKAIFIFVTSMENRAVDGYDINAFAYVLKDKAEEKLPEIFERLWQDLSVRTIIINEKNTAELIATSDILAAESLGRCALLYTYNGEIKVNDTISRLAEKLPKDLFVECHKSVYVNIAKIRKIDTNFLLLENDKKLPVSRRNRKSVMTSVMRRVSSK